MSWLKDDSKSEKPTPRRREKVRSEGSVAKSPELTSSLMLLSSVLLLILLGPAMMRDLSALTASFLTQSGTTELSVSALPQQMLQTLLAVTGILAPMFLALMGLGLAVNISQVGFRVTMQAACPKFSRINPLSGFGRLFSPHSVVELMKNIIKLAAVGLVLFTVVKAQFRRLFTLSSVPFDDLLSESGSIAIHVALWAAICLVIIGILDFFYNRYEHEQSLMMTKEEVKEESRQSEGDPLIKGKVREIMIKRSIQRMMKRVQEADVVITNPIHLAVALKYDRQKSVAPVVVAKGARKVAERIKEIAAEHSIPIVENKPLAQALYKLVDVGQEIPADLYRAVAEVLAYVYRLKKKFFGVA